MDAYANIPIKAGSIAVHIDSGFIFTANGTLHALTAGNAIGNRVYNGTLEFTIPQELIADYATLGFHSLVYFNGRITFTVS